MTAQRATPGRGPVDAVAPGRDRRRGRIRGRVGADGRGFTLIEVLITILILSIALLGLGSLLPAVLTAQRAGADDADGAMTAQAVRDRLERFESGSAAVVVNLASADTTQGTPVDLTAPFQGSFQIDFPAPISGTTAELPLSATAAQIREAIERLPGVGAGNVEVERPAVRQGDRAGYRLSVRFVQRLANLRLQGQVTASVTPLGGVGGAVVLSGPVRTVRNGVIDPEDRPMDPDLITAWARYSLRASPPIDPNNEPAANPENLIPGDGSWMVPGTSPEGTRIELGVDQSAGLSAGDPVRQLEVPVRERLVRLPAGGLGVWDVALRRLGPIPAPTASGSTPVLSPSREATRVQAALFVMGVDPNIFVVGASGQPAPPVSDSIADESLGTPPTSAAAAGPGALRRYAVGVDGAGRPTRTGLGQAMARPIIVNVEFDPGRDPLPGNVPVRDRLYINSAAGNGGVDESTPFPGSGLARERNLLALLTQNGQRVVDSLGNVHTIVGLDDRLPDAVTSRAVRLARPVPRIGDESAAARATLDQVVVMPVVPLSVEVFVVNP